MILTIPVSCVSDDFSFYCVFWLYICCLWNNHICSMNSLKNLVLNPDTLVRTIFALLFAFWRFHCWCFNNFWWYASDHFFHKETFHITILQQKYCCCRLQPHFFSGVKLSKEVCIHHIEHEPILLTVEEIYFCMIAHQIH